MLILLDHSTHKDPELHHHEEHAKLQEFCKTAAEGEFWEKNALDASQSHGFTNPGAFCVHKEPSPAPKKPKRGVSRQHSAAHARTRAKAKSDTQEDSGKNDGDGKDDGSGDDGGGKPKANGEMIDVAVPGPPDDDFDIDSGCADIRDIVAHRASEHIPHSNVKLIVPTGLTTDDPEDLSGATHVTTASGQELWCFMSPWTAPSSTWKSS